MRRGSDQHRRASEGLLEPAQGLRCQVPTPPTVRHCRQMSGEGPHERRRRRRRRRVVEEGRVRVGTTPPRSPTLRDASAPPPTHHPKAHPTHEPGEETTKGGEGWNRQVHASTRRRIQQPMTNKPCSVVTKDLPFGPQTLWRPCLIHQTPQTHTAPPPLPPAPWASESQPKPKRQRRRHQRGRKEGG